MVEEGSNSQTASPCTPTTDTKKLGFYSSHQSTYFHTSPSLAKRCHESAPDAIPVSLQGSKTSKLVIGRGHDATIKIGRSNKRVSREHVAIEHKPHLNGFEMTILSPNGALIDHIIFDQGEHVPIVEGTIIEIVGNKLIFRGPGKEEKEEQDNIPIPEVVTTVTTTTTNIIEKQDTLTPINTTVENVEPEEMKTMFVEKSMTLEDEIIQVLGKFFAYL